MTTLPSTATGRFGATAMAAGPTASPTPHQVATRRGRLVGEVADEQPGAGVDGAEAAQHHHPGADAAGLQVQHTNAASPAYPAAPRASARPGSSAGRSIRPPASAGRRRCPVPDRRTRRTRRRHQGAAALSVQTAVRRPVAASRRGTCRRDAAPHAHPVQADELAAPVVRGERDRPHRAGGEQGGLAGAERSRTAISQARLERQEVGSPPAATTSAPACITVRWPCRSARRTGDRPDQQRGQRRRR